MKKFNIIDLSYKLNSLMLGRRNYKEVAYSSWICCPENKSTSPRAIFHLGDLDKVTAVQHETDIARERVRIFGGERTHAATVGYRLRDVQVVDGRLYKGCMKYNVRGGGASVLTHRLQHEINFGCLSSSPMGCKYFGHWMRDDLPRYLASLDIGPALTVVKKMTPHQFSYASVFGINAVPLNNGVVKDLVILEDFGQNKHKRERYNFLRAEIQRKYPISSKSGVFILRGNSGDKRQLLNEHEVIEFLKKKDFNIVNPEKESVDQIISKCRVDILIGVEGSHLSHFNYSGNDQGAIIAIQPPDRFNNVYKDYADCVDMTYGFIVGNRHSSGCFTVDIGGLDDILNQVVHKINIRSY